MSMSLRSAGAGLIFLMLQAGAAAAGSVTVAPDPQNARNIVVEARDASVAEIVARLQEAQPFEVERLGEPSASPITRRYAGEFRHVLERVLENENHLVVTTVQSRDVQRVVLYGSRIAAPSVARTAEPVTSAAPPAGKPPIDPVVQAALERARQDAEAANARGVPLPHEVNDPGPPRRAALNAGGRSIRSRL